MKTHKSLAVGRQLYDCIPIDALHPLSAEATGALDRAFDFLYRGRREIEELILKQVSYEVS